MAAATPKIAPIAFKELLQLTQQGIQASDIKFKNVTLSDKYLCVREEGKSVAIIDLGTRNMLRLPVAVESAIMNPVSKVVALRDANNNLQIYNLEMKTKMKSTTISSGVVFWRWLDPKTIAIVTDSSVYHWSMEGDKEPEKMFDRAAYEGQVQIINYQSSKDEKWLLLGGISAGASGGIVGVLQVYSVDMKASQPTMDAHAACFSTITVDGRESESNLFCFTKSTAEGPRLNIIEVGVPKEKAFTKSAVMRFQPNDFPVSMLPDNKHGMVYVLSKAGWLSVFEIQSGKMVFTNQASQATMFASCVYGGTEGGLVAVDQKGRVMHFYVDDKNIVNYICTVMNDLELGIQLAKRFNLGGAERFFKEQFTRLMGAQRTQEAMELAASSPQGILRTVETINALKAVPGGQGLLQYFQLLLKKGKLNAIESIELARPVLAKNSPQGMEHIKEWLKEQKLEPSEDLGDLLKNHNITLALSVYLRAKVPEKVIGCFLSLGAQEANDAAASEHFKNIIAYAKRATFNPDYPILVQQLLRVNSDRAKDFALSLLTHEDGPKIDIQTTVDTFMSVNDVKNTTNILLEYLKPRGDREEDGALQTRLLEINLLQMPQVADAIMESDEFKFTHYDRLKIAQLCERAQLYQRALEHYTDLTDIKRVLSNTHLLNPEFLLEFFGRMTPENCLDCLRDLLKYNITANLRLVVEVAKKWNDYLTPTALINLFEEFKSFNGIYFFLGSFVNFSTDTKVVFKFIEAATKLNQLKEVERVCRDNEHYDAKEVKEFLIQQNLKDPRPLIHVCDRFGYVDELTQYLYNGNLYMFIEAYVQRMNVNATPAVVGSLLDLNANEDQVKKLLTPIRPPPENKEFVEKLVTEVEKRNRLKILKPWLETRAQEGNTDAATHNGLAKIYVEIGNNPQQFLTTNRHYDSKVVGKYCEGRDPHLAFLAYKRAWGECDTELIEVTNKNGFFKDQARYLVERQDLELWAKVLTEENQFRRQLIDQVVATALPESRVPEEVSNTVKAFMAANLPNELIELLEKIILHGPADSDFHNNRNLQNLLILTAIKADKKRVMAYIQRLDNYDGPDIAKIAISDQYKLYEEAVFIYKKFQKGPECIQVLLENIESIDRATEFAEYWDKPDVWSILAKAQLEARLIKESINSFLKADDPTHFQLVINAAKGANLHAELITYIQMARNKLKDVVLDNELIYCYAKTEKLTELEEFINQPNVSKLQDVGDACFNEKLYKAARILYNHINNNAKLAICLVRLEFFQEAVDAARKANAIPTWKAVCFACVDAQKFRLAQMCGVNIIVYQEHLMDLVRHYERGAHFNELIQLLEQGMNLERAHQGIFTQLGVCYSKYNEDKLMEHVKLSWSRLNIPTLLQSCQSNLHWPEAVFLYTHYDQFDNAIDVLINHSAECWKHDLFKEIIIQCANTEIYYRALDFYVREHPLLLSDLLLDLKEKLDHTRVVDRVKSTGHLPLVQKYLLHVQRENVAAVNEAINGLYLQEENFKGLRESIDQFDQYDQIALAQATENHELVEFRRISSYIYKLNKRWERSIEISKKDKLWQDAMETASDSKLNTLADDLLNFFVTQGLKECVGAMLYACYELLRPDVVLEVAWRFGLQSFAMPYMIQTFRDYNDKLVTVNEKVAALDKALLSRKAQEEAAAGYTGESAVVPGFGGMGMLAITAPPSFVPPPMYPPGQQFGYPGAQPFYGQ